MPTKAKLITQWIGAVVLLAMSATVVSGMYHVLDSPRIAMGIPKADYAPVQAVLERKDCRFLGGAELNASTSLRYGGDTIAVNQFIEALAACPNVVVHVNFYRPTGGAVECDWMVTHMAPSNELVVRINLASEKIKLENLYLPPVKVPEQKPTASTAPK